MQTLLGKSCAPRSISDCESLQGLPELVRNDIKEAERPIILPMECGVDTKQARIRSVPARC
jgi:hypothetical protein